MATTDLHVVSAPAPAADVAAPARRTWAAPAVSAGIGAVLGAVAAWLLVANDALEMTFRTMGM